MQVGNITKTNIKIWFSAGFIVSRETRKGKLVLVNYVNNTKYISSIKVPLQDALHAYLEWSYEDNNT